MDTAKTATAPVSVKDALVLLREGTGESITRPELYSYIRIGALKADFVARTFLVDRDSLKHLISQIQSAKGAK